MNNLIILVIDDDPVFREMVRVTLEIENYQIVEAQNGQAAIDLMDKIKPDLIMQNLKLPDMNAFDLNRVLLALSLDEHIPILAVTEFHIDLDANERHHGFDNIILKPIEPHKLVESIKRYLNHKKENIKK